MIGFIKLIWFCLLGSWLYVAEAYDSATSKPGYKPGSSSRNRGKWAIVTGGNGGIGLATCKALLQDGVHVVVACRSPKAGAEACTLLQPFASHGATVETISLDLSSMTSVKSFAAAFLQTGRRLDILICNAGIMAVPFKLTSDGFESQVGTNHLGHYLLIKLLLPAMLKPSTSTTGDLSNQSVRNRKSESAPADLPRVVLVTSSTHFHCPALDFATWTSGDNYSAGLAYEQSKLANVMTAIEMQRRLGDKVRFYAVHPGIVATNITRGLPLGLPYFVNFVGRLAFKTPEQGAATQVHCALANADEVPAGKYYMNCHVAASSPLSLDAKLCGKVIEETERLLAPFLVTAEKHDQ
jgi:NAD(P)-dependent dehydrogenase (short-subunit alcohol dehydrogenase family)